MPLVRKYGIKKFEAHKKALFDFTEKMMRAEIDSIPNGTYEGKSMVYYDGKHKGSKFEIRAGIKVKAGEIIFDFSKSSPQTKGFVNGTYTSTCSAITLTFLQMINPDIPHNEGMCRPLKYIVPEGTILNASYPAAYHLWKSPVSPRWQMQSSKHWVRQFRKGSPPAGTICCVHFSRYSSAKRSKVR